MSQNPTGFLPISKEDMIARGWYYCDFLLVTGDAYLDHPSFGTAVISRVLEDAGFQGPMWNALKGETCTGPELLEMARRQEGRLDISQLRQASERQFAALDKFIKT